MRKCEDKQAVCSSSLLKPLGGKGYSYMAIELELD